MSELKPCPFCGGKAERKETEKYIGLGRSMPQYFIKWFYKGQKTEGSKT